MQWQGTFDPFTAGADPGSFLGGGAPLRNGITNTNKSHFCAEYQLYYKAVGHLRGGGGGEEVRTPNTTLDPPLCCSSPLERNALTKFGDCFKYNQCYYTMFDGEHALV